MSEKQNLLNSLKQSDRDKEQHSENLELEVATWKIKCAKLEERLKTLNEELEKN